MIFNEQQVCLNEVGISLKKYLDFLSMHKEQAASVDTELSQELRVLESRSEQLDQMIGELGVLPREPDPEKEVLEKVVTEVRGLLDNQQDQAWRELLQAERQELKKKLHDAIALEYQDPVSELLKALQSDLEQNLYGSGQ